jgi:hypothetical protein
LFFKVKAIFKKYVDAEESYITLLAASTILSYYQDKFGTIHYIIIIGDNGSGKNSALLVYRLIGYRVFYVTAASAANYYTKHLGKDLTSMFIQFAEECFTDYTADHLHNPTVKSCLLRVPGSLNTKCIPNKGQDPGIKIIQRWDGKRPSIKPLLRDFRRWLIQKRIDDIEELKKQEKKHAKFQMVVSPHNQERTNKVTRIKWIEKGILENPLPDHRKYIIWRILSPYLLNVKKMPKEESYSVIKGWLDKCDIRKVEL